MATLQEIQNLVKCGAGAVLGTGLKGCRASLEKVSAIWLTPAGFKFDGTRTLDEAYVQELQQAGDLIVLRGIRAFTDNSADNTTEELEDGTLQVARLGLYQFQANFINGLAFNAALSSLSGFGNYDTTFIDRDGNIFGTKANDGSLKGFTTGMIQNDGLTWATDTTAQRESISWQLLERSEVDLDYVFIQRKQLGFNPKSIEGINQINLKFSTVPAAGTSIVVKAKTKQDGKPFTGLLSADFLVTTSGASAEPTGAAESPDGTYTLTVTSVTANDDVSVQLYDSTLNSNVIIKDVDLYKSNVVSAVVV